MRTSLPLMLVFSLVAACVGTQVPRGSCPGIAETSDYSIRVRVGVEQVWTSSKATLSSLSLQPIEVDEDRRTAVLDIGHSKVTVSVEAVDIEESTIHVSALRSGAGDVATATLVQDKILSDLERKH